jgi:Tol biopolymer transport system component
VLQQVLACPQALCRSPQPSPDGQFLAYESVPLSTGSGQPAPASVWLLPLTGGDPQLAGDADHLTSQPAWSSAGWLSFYDKTQQAYVLLNPNTQKQHLLPNQTGESGAWKPDGSAFVAAEILFEEVGLLEPRASAHLIRYDLESPASAIPTAMLDLTHDSDLEDASPAYSPDGKLLALERKYLDNTRWTPGRQLWLMEADGSQAKPLTDAPLYSHYDIAWSADGSRIAFLRFNQATLTDPPELWLIDADGTDPVQLVVGGYAPLWIP